jgi:carboxyl-terminal processing protease
MSMWNTAKKMGRRHISVRQVAILLGIVALVIGAYLYGRSQSLAGLSAQDRESVDLYVEALDTVEQDYVDQEAIDPKKQTYGAIKGMLDSLGDEGHTRFLTPDEAEKNHEVMSSKYVGVGIRLANKNDKVVVSSPLDGSPAKEAGIKSGDVVVAVDGEKVQDEDFKKVGEKIRGPEGSQVDLTVLRDDEEYDFSLQRAELEVPTATWKLIPDTDVAYVRLATFSENSSAKFDEAINEAQDAGARRLVLDIRDNSGGLVEQAEKVAARFLPAQSVVYIRKDADGQEEEVKVPDDNEPLEVPLVVLANEGSSSSAEILAGALKDNDRAKVVGEKTFGTGTVLAEHTLSDGSSILLGTAEWLTPNGDFIRGSGIAPDVEAKLEEGQEPQTTDEIEDLSKDEIFSKDAQLERAFEVLQEEE